MLSYGKTNSRYSEHEIKDAISTQTIKFRAYVKQLSDHLLHTCREEVRAKRYKLAAPFSPVPHDCEMRFNTLCARVDGI